MSQWFPPAKGGPLALFFCIGRLERDRVVGKQEQKLNADNTDPKELPKSPELPKVPKLKNKTFETRRNGGHPA